MPIPNVDTFEHDIAEEIKTKEASLTDIASAGGDVSNVGGQSVQTSNMLLLVGILCIVLVIASILVFLFLYKKSSPAIPPLTATSTQTSSNTELASLSPTLNDALGSSIGTVSKSQYGYSLQLLAYSSVFSYMIKNEGSYADELARAIGSPRDTSTTTEPFSFTDVTLSNQNMRVGASGSSTIVYAFVNAQTLLVSSSTTGILSLRNAILK